MNPLHYYSYPPTACASSPGWVPRGLFVFSSEDVPYSTCVCLIRAERETLRLCVIPRERRNSQSTAQQRFPISAKLVHSNVSHVHREPFRDARRRLKTFTRVYKGLGGSFTYQPKHHSVEKYYEDLKQKEIQQKIDAGHGVHAVAEWRDGVPQHSASSSSGEMFSLDARLALELRDDGDDHVRQRRREIQHKSE